MARLFPDSENPTQFAQNTQLLAHRPTFMTRRFRSDSSSPPARQSAQSPFKSASSLLTLACTAALTVSPCFGQINQPPSLPVIGDATQPGGSSDSALSQPVPFRIADSIDAAIDNLDEQRIPKFTDAASTVQQNLDATRQFFASKTDPSNFDAWMSFLKLDLIADAIDSGESEVDVAREAIDLRFRLIGIDPGLELTVLRQLRSSLDPLIASVRFRDPSRSIRGIGKQMESTATALRQDARPISPAVIDEINTLLELLIAGDQVPELVATIRSYFSANNVGVLISEPIIQSAANRAVLQNRSINDCILGTRVIGAATVTGTLTGDLKPSVGSALLQLNLNGRIVSNNTGYNGPVRLRTVGYGMVAATRMATIDLTGLRLGPTSVAATLNTDVVSITPTVRFGKRIVRKIATNRVAQQKPDADRIAIEKLRQQIRQQFDDQTQTAAQYEPLGLFDRAAATLQRLSLPQPTRTIGSTETELTFDGMFRRDDQLAALTPRPPIRMNNGFAAVTSQANGFPSESSRVATPSVVATGQPISGEWIGIQIHESAINNASTPVLAGRTLSQSQIQSLIKKTNLPLPSGIGAAGQSDQNSSDSADQENSNFEIDFARVRPLVFEARDGAVRLGVRGTRFAQGTRELKRDLEIYADYIPAIAADGTMLLIRRGEGRVDFPGPAKRLSMADAGLRRTIEKRFATAFPETLLTRPIPVPETAKLPSLAGRQLRVQSIDIESGWLSVVVQ